MVFGVIEDIDGEAVINYTVVDTHLVELTEPYTGRSLVILWKDDLLQILDALEVEERKDKSRGYVDS